MAKNYNQSCDACGRILYGQDRGAFIREDNIFFNGQMGRNYYEKDTGYAQTIYYTRAKDQASCFCNPECLVDWMKMEEQLYENRKKARLMEEVNQPPAQAHKEEPAYRSFGTPPANAPSKAPQAPNHFRYGEGVDRP